MSQTTPTAPTTTASPLSGSPVSGHNEPELIPRSCHWVIGPAVLALLTFIMFVDVLFTSSRVLGSPSADMASQFIPWRDFGFSQLRKGNLALWNPHIYGGTPYFAGFQAALLYPPNWVHLFLPVSTAINWVIASHTFFAGYFTYLWCRSRQIGIGGSILAGIMFMFSGPFFLHIYAGHLPHLAAMVWAPLMLLAIDKLADTGEWLKWTLAGIGATSMHILAGHPQYVLYTGMTLSVYAALRLTQSAHRKELMAGFVAMYVGAALVTAAQLLPGIQAAGEQVRSGGTEFQFASTFSLNPWNLVTLLVPSFLGSVRVGPEPPGTAYWASGYLQEMSFFVSITGLVIAILGATRGLVESRRQRGIVIIILAMLLFTFIMALGRRTPVYRLLYDYLPFYGSFRGTVKFAYLSVLMISLLAAMGFDSLLRQRRVSWATLYSLILLLIALFALGEMVGSWAGQGKDGPWWRFVAYLRDTARQTNDLYLFINRQTGDITLDVEEVVISGQYAARLVYGAAAMVAWLAAVLWTIRYHQSLPYLLILMACTELFIFAHATRATFDPVVATTLPEPWRPAIQKLEKDQRVLMADPRALGYANIGMSLGFDGITGSDPGVFKRYAELLSASQGQDPARANQYFRFEQINSVLRWLRCALIFVDPTQPPTQVPGPFPVALVVSDYLVLNSREEVLRYLVRPDFNPARTVVLESFPAVTSSPSDAPAGAARVVSQTTDTLELQVEVNRPGVLVVTNNYSTGWRVHPITSRQISFNVMPANYTLIGIPLERGKHHLLLEYAPLAFRIGAWVSAVGLVGIGAGLLWLIRPAVWLR